MHYHRAHSAACDCVIFCSSDSHLRLGTPKAANSVITLLAFALEGEFLKAVDDLLEAKAAPVPLPMTKSSLERLGSSVSVPEQRPSREMPPGAVTLQFMPPRRLPVWYSFTTIDDVVLTQAPQTPNVGDHGQVQLPVAQVTGG